MLAGPGHSEMTRGRGTMPDSGAAPGWEATAQEEGEVYTWHDGDRVMSAWLQSDLAVSADGAIIQRSTADDGTAGTAEVTGGTDGGGPVFRSSSGALMALPGGVLICLNPEWSETQIETFFTSNGIDMSTVSPINEYLDDCFIVETDPGFASLNLANALAGQAGVEISSPNWWTEVSTR